MDYSEYRELHVRRLEPGILEIVMGEEGGKLSITTARMHGEMARIWVDIDRDPETRVAILRGAGKGFSAGGDMAMVEEMTRDFGAGARVGREARDLVYNMLNCSKIIVSAMHGPAVGAGLAAGLMADISIAARNARLIDGHTRLGVAAGDHAAIIWPLLCGMAKAKYYLLLCELIDAASVQAAVDKVLQRFKRIDVLCNIAGAFRMGSPVHETSDEDWNFLIDVNVRTLLHASRAVVPVMLAAGGGKIV